MALFLICKNYLSSLFKQKQIEGIRILKGDIILGLGKI